jgi:hypothetical protein
MRSLTWRCSRSIPAGAGAAWAPGCWPGWKSRPGLPASIGCGWTREVAIAFYLEQGFRRVQTVPGYYEGLVDAVKLEKRFTLGV